MIRLSRITIYPIKSLDGHDLSTGQLLDSGPLGGDRRFRLVKENGEVVGVRNERRLARVRSRYDAALTQVTLSDGDSTAEEFALNATDGVIAEWFTNLLSYRVRLEENQTVGFPDDLEASGPTLLSQGTLRQIAEWFPGLEIEEAFRRMRANFVVDSDEPFWEDRLVGENGPVRFAIGRVNMRGEKVCQRCVIPSIDSQTSAPTSDFVRELTRLREQHLPPDSPRARFDHFYRVSINTNLDDETAPSERVVATGDDIRLLDRN